MNYKIDVQEQDKYGGGESPFRNLVESFLNLPLDRTSELFELFASLPGAVEGRGEAPMQRFVYIPGTRKDRILLVAHADTVWDAHYGSPVPRREPVVYQRELFHSAEATHGIGADDRAGCAMLWVLRDSGHSLLVLDGEERGKIGARYLKKKHRRLFREINRTHRMMIELDSRGGGLCLFDQVDNTDAFKRYIQEKLGVRQDMHGGGCDLQILCHKVCGVNLGIGYGNEHTSREYLYLPVWRHVLHTLENFLAVEHPRFPISKKRRAAGYLRRVRNRLLSPLRGRKNIR